MNAIKIRTLIKRKIPIASWLIDVFSEHGIDTSIYIIDRNMPPVEPGSSGEQQSSFCSVTSPPEDTEVDHLEKTAPLPSVTKLIESNPSPPSAEPDPIEKDLDSPTEKLEKNGLDSPIIIMYINQAGRRAKTALLLAQATRMALSVKFTNSGLDPPYNGFRQTSGTDPPRHSKVRIQSPSYLLNN